MRKLKRILKYFFATVGTILFLLLIVLEFYEYVPLPNGLYIYKTPFIPAAYAEYNFYIYNQDDELVIDKPVEFICFNDDYIELIYYRSKYTQGIYLYEIATKKGFNYPDPEYMTKVRSSGLMGDGTSCNGHLKYNAGANLIWMKPWILTGDPVFSMRRNNQPP